MTLCILVDDLTSVLMCKCILAVQSAFWYGFFFSFSIIKAKR